MSAHFSVKRGAFLFSGEIVKFEYNIMKTNTVRKSLYHIHNGVKFITKQRK